jgi:hypothetical protein
MVIGENQIIRCSEHTNSNVFVFNASEQSFSCFLTGFDSGYVMDASMQSGDERLFKTIITP